MITYPTPEGVTTRPIGLDFTAVMLAGAGRGVDMRMLTDILPRIEAAIINPPEPGDDLEDDADADS